MKFCAQRGCQVPIASIDVLCPCCRNPLADDGVPQPPASIITPLVPTAPAPAQRLASSDPEGDQQARADAAAEAKVKPKPAAKSKPVAKSARKSRR